MIKLLITLGAMTLNTTNQVTHLLTEYEDSANETSETELIEREFKTKLVVDNTEFDAGKGNVKLGSVDISNDIEVFIESMRTLKHDNNVYDFKINSSKGKFVNSEKPGTINVGQELGQIIKAEEYIIQEASAWADGAGQQNKNYYGLNVSAQADGENIYSNLMSYEETLFWNYEILSDYEIDFDVTYSAWSGRTHTDNGFYSDIYLPNLGIDFTVEQIKQMFSIKENSFYKDSLNYVNNLLEIELTDISITQLYRVEQKGSIFEKGKAYEDNETMKEDYFYISWKILSVDEGFDMIVSK